MERSGTYKLAKWIYRKIFLDHGTIIPVPKLLGWTDKMTKDQHDIFLTYEAYIGNMNETVTIIDGPSNAVGIAKHFNEYAMKHGRIEKIDEYNKVYIPHHEMITLIVVDHIGLHTKTRRGPDNKKASY